MSDAIHAMALAIASGTCLDPRTTTDELAAEIEGALREVEAATMQRALRMGRGGGSHVSIPRDEYEESQPILERLPLPPPAPPLGVPAGPPTVCIALGSERSPANGLSPRSFAEPSPPAGGTP